MAGNLSTLGFGGSTATTSVVNAHSSGGTTSGIQIAATAANGMKSVLSGALTSGALATVLSVTGAGAVPALTAYTADATARTVRLKVTVDGVVVFDATSSSITTASHGIFAAGFVGGSNTFQQGEPIQFSASLTVEVASSLTETDKISVGYILYKR